MGDDPTQPLTLILTLTLNPKPQPKRAINAAAPRLRKTRKFLTVADDDSEVQTHATRFSSQKHP